jgi:hypothetical protein
LGSPPFVFGLLAGGELEQLPSISKLVAQNHKATFISPSGRGLRWLASDRGPKTFSNEADQHNSQEEAEKKNDHQTTPSKGVHKGVKIVRHGTSFHRC